jgi:hypothetical protein
MDKVLFDKPNFQIFVDENTREEPVSTKDHKERSLAIIVRNTGFRDAYSVRTNVHLLTPDFKIRNIIPRKETQMIKIGEDREWLLPIPVLTYSKEETDYSAGWIRVEVLSALSRRYYFFYYKIEKNELEVRDTRKFLRSIKPFMTAIISIPFIELVYDSFSQFIYEISYIIKNKQVDIAPIKFKLDQKE